MADICAYARYENATGDGVNGIVVTWDCEQITRSTGARAALFTAQATNIVVGRRGLYGYFLTGADLTLYDYVFTAVTAAATPTSHEVAAVWTLWSLSWHDVLTTALTAVGSIGKLLVDNLDATISGIPAAVWGFGARALTSFGTLVADITAAISAILCNVWACGSRTLTMSLAAIKSMLLGSKLELWRGDTFAQTFTGLGDLTGITNLWFTVKKQDLNDIDAAAEIQISQTGGLLAIAGAPAATPANGSITINAPATAGSITVALAAVEMAKLDIDFTGYWDIQKLTGTTVVTITRGNASVLGDVTRRII
jgi:hypothetical protein